MNAPHSVARSSQGKHGPLSAQLAWFIRLRWVAGVAMLVVALADGRWLHWFDRGPESAVLGAVVLVCNLALSMILSQPLRGRGALVLFAWAQLLLDFVCLTLLTIWTGGLLSPVATFFIFHMVFASLLLPRRMAYAAALAAIAMLACGLWISDQFPTDRRGQLLLAGRALTLLLTVYLANHMTHDLRRQQRRLIRQNKHIRRISRQLRRHQEALVQHEKMVALGRMAAGIAHEITNPLASMDSVLQLLQRKPERLRPDVVQTLREQTERIGQIIAQMKAFAHPVDSQRKVLRLNEVVDGAIALVRFDKRVKHVQLIRHFSPDAGSVAVVRQALEQVLVNLIINALDAVADVPEPKVIVRTDRRDGTCYIEVCDNGRGIQPQHMRRLFEPFFTTKPVGQGTGLGLSISYSLMERYGGAIAVRSQPGKGATFTIKLEAEKPSPQHVLVPAQS
jgi:C4-dicarboxylate-specific signal transduction histidine kinase